MHFALARLFEWKNILNSYAQVILAFEKNNNLIILLKLSRVFSSEAMINRKPFGTSKKATTILPDFDLMKTFHFIIIDISITEIYIL